MTTKRVNTSNRDIFMLWMEIKNQTKVATRLALMGDYNHKTKKPFNPATITNCINEWMIENQIEAKIMIENSFYGGKKIPLDAWNRYMVKCAMVTYDTSWKRQKDWIKRHGMEQYKELWDRHSPTGTLD